MSELDSTNIVPPFLGPGYPNYPELPQLVRITGPAVHGTVPAVYPGVVEQVDPATLTIRDREAAWVTEPNGNPLGPAVYDCRLVGAWPPSGANVAPLFATCCCSSGSTFPSSAVPVGSGSLSSSSGH